MPVQTIKDLCLVVGAALVATGVAAAEPIGAMARLAPALGNVIVSTHPDGRQARLWLRRDGSWAAQGRAGNRSAGTWKIRGEKLCLKQRTPVQIPIAYCKPVPAEGVDKQWRDVAVNGDQVTNEIVRASKGDARQ